MTKNVILFLTSPDSLDRIEMVLNNFKQLEKLGYDIITLTTSDLLPKYIYEKSITVIHDYNIHRCTKKDYYEFKKETHHGYFYNHRTNNGWSIHLFTDTNFPSVLRNLKTMIHVANAMNYEKYFYVEDDHYFDERDFQKIHDYFSKLDNFDLLLFTYKRYGNEPENKEMVTCSYFHFGRPSSMVKVSQNFVYTAKDFISKNKYLYLQFYEYMFGTVIRENIYEGFKLHEESFMEIGVSLAFPHSKINMVYSHRRKDSQTRTALLLRKNTNEYFHFYSADELDKVINLKYYVRSQPMGEVDVYPGCWQIWRVDINDINDFEVLIDNTIKQDFSKQVIRDIVYNGDLIMD